VCAHHGRLWEWHVPIRFQLPRKHPAALIQSLSPGAAASTTEIADALVDDGSGNLKPFVAAREPPMTRLVSTLAVAMLAVGLLGTPGSLAAQDSGAGGPAASPRPGYLIVLGTEIDRKQIGIYARAANPIVTKFGGRLLVATQAGVTEVAEGKPFPGSVRVFEFPSVAAARAFYYSPEYQAIIPLRKGHAKFDILISDAFFMPAAVGTEGQ
jgi:uncharacterized protein (DUF1330 family)